MSVTLQSYAITSLRGLSPAEASALKTAGIDTTAKLLAAATSASKEKALAAKAGISHAVVREAVNRADLQRISGIGPATADLFENAGVNSAKELALRSATALRATLAKFIAENPALGYRLPSPTTVASLVAKAKVVSGATGEGPPSTARAAKYLKMEVVRWHLKHRNDLPPGANDGFQAQSAVTAAGFTQVTDPDDNPHGHDLAKHTVYRHADVIFPGSDRAWFVVFEKATGKFVEAYDFN